jgi:hypothetical protein
MGSTDWAKPADQYKDVHVQPRSRTERVSNPVHLDATGITWNQSAVDVSLLTKQPVDRTRARFRASLAGFVWDAAALEGNTFTLPEVQTLLDGVTVGGKPLDDEKQVLALRDAFVELDRLIDSGSFRLDKPTSDRLHALLAPHEAIEAGHFRGEGSAKGGGVVSLGERGIYRASRPGPKGQTLIGEYRALLNHLATVSDPREQALAYCAAATRRQFYFDGNKRLARLMMNGHLMSHGYDAISVSANRRVEFNEHLITLFDTADATDLMVFTLDSRPKDADDD